MPRPIIERLESNVRSYCRSFPTTFVRARGSVMIDDQGRQYLDFFAGAGALNYGHNNPHLKQALVAYLMEDGLTHSLDMATEAKCALLQTLESLILKPRNLDYKVMFPGPTGTNAVEAALKLARKVTGRPSVLGFTNGFHGMTLGALSVTGNQSKRRGAGVPLPFATSAPFFGYTGAPPRDDRWVCGSLELLERQLSDASSGLDKPAAIIIETVQAEGGVNPASARYLRQLRELTQRHEVLLIVDDIQVGCGRTGAFFSFEEAGILPDIITLSKSISGFGLPMSLTLMRPELDVWEPAEHNGTFRGHNLAFVTAAAALKHYWADDALCNTVKDHAQRVRAKLGHIAQHCGATSVRGRGLIQGLVFEDRPHIPSAISQKAFERGLIIETAGARDEVLKLLPPLTTTWEELERGLSIIEESALAVAV
mgnify:CR=1 FL=1